MTSQTRLALLVAALLCFPATSAFAQESSPPAPTPPAETADENRSNFTIGGGATYMPSYEGSNDYIISPAVAARGKIEGFSFFTRNTQLFVDLIPNPSGPSFDFQLGPVGGVNLNRTGRLVDPRIKALGSRKVAIEAGGFIGIGKTGLITSDYDNLTLRVAYVHDVSQIYRSYVVTPSIEYGTPLSRKAFVALSVSADYAGAGYSRAYFDVDAAGAARSGLPVFSGGKGWKDVTFGVVGSHSLTGDLLHGLGLYVTGSYSRMQDDFAASPVTRIAGSPDQWFGAVGLGYTF
ncbi:MAG: MltA-interacting MipA [Sphingomonas bacterium]|uniref:MipA/OmpV family protein n=1 Tax=Sphingomonas bacterium TaxID=1895847 RepID=UPI0026394845|nr:MipA/OmpV family protein [Sphingomonas bacterium]MDB5707069.1 MltA-interacting MipA [Sphingomonas bacterium]